MKKNGKKWILGILVLVLAGTGIFLLQQKRMGDSKKWMYNREVENEIEAASGVRLESEGRFLTYAGVEEILERLHLSEYITYEKQSGIKKVKREDWHKIYAEILDYLDTAKEVKTKELLILGINEKEELLYTSGGTFFAKGVQAEILEKYRFYVSGNQLLGMVEKTKGNTVLSNAYLKSMEEKKVTILFDGKTYDFSVEGSGNTMKNVVCDLVLEDGKIREIRQKGETITGKLITMDGKEAEIEGYGRIPLAGRVPAYKLYGTLEEKSLKDIVIGNMKAEYVVGEGKVQAVLLKEPADIQNIRVLLLNGDQPYYENVFLTGDKDFVLELGDKKKECKAGLIVSVKAILGEGKSCCLKSKEGGRFYLTKEDGEKTTLGYEGNLELRNTQKGFTVVNEVSFEDYICGVLPSEMPEKFDSEALKAQAVCARSYAYRQLMKGDYAAFGAHIDDSTNYQVYNKKEVGEKSRRAVEDTFGMVMKYGENVIEAYYYSTSCGHTGTLKNWNIKGDETTGYLKERWVKEEQKKTDLSKEKNFRKYITKADDDCFDGKVPYFRWRAVLDFNGKDEAVRSLLTEAKNTCAKNIDFRSKDGKKKKTLKGFGAVTEVSVKKRGTSGAIEQLLVDFENGEALVKNEYNIRKVLGAAITEVVCQDGTKNEKMTVLPSAYAIVDYQKDEKKAVVSGGGFGHGIGMSQYGADGMAKAGYSYDEILTFFYSDVAIESIY